MCIIIACITIMYIVRIRVTFYYAPGLDMYYLTYMIIMVYMTLDMALTMTPDVMVEGGDDTGHDNDNRYNG